ncbi:MAG: transketolase family protein [Myxococcota bacterium]
MRNVFAETLYEEARKDPRIFIVVADISPAGSMSEFRREFPERFINVGVAEQSMIGICAGLALRGCRPFAYTIATFSLYRPFEIIRDDLCYQNLPVTVVGIGGGVVYSTLGGTHHAQEDVAVSTAIPNMSVLAPCDPPEVAAATRFCARESKGPVYLRLGKAGEPTLTADAPEAWEFGRLRYVRRGRDVCIISYGLMVARAVAIADRLRAKGRSVSVVSAHTLKPLNADDVTEILETHRSVVVLEEHSPYGGLAPRIKEIAWDHRATCSLQSFTLQDAFIHCYGSHDELLAAHGLDVERIAASI